MNVTMDAAAERGGVRVLPLDGITVVGIEQAVAAPLATRHCADLGARVVKVERIDGGDFARGYDDAVNGMAAHFFWLNRGKESLAVDLKSDKGKQILEELILSADVFVQNLAPGAATRLGFSAQELRKKKPELIVVDMSGYGTGGPYSQKPGYDLLLQGEGGLASVTGTEDTPVKTGIPTVDIGAGMYAFTAILSALVRRERGGGGASIEVSMLDAIAEWMGHSLYYTKGTGNLPKRSALGHPSVVPYAGYPTADGSEVLIGIQNDREWTRLCTDVLERAELARDPEYATNIARTRNRNAVDEAIAEKTSKLSSKDLVAKLDAASIANARLNDVHGLIEHPQLAARDRWRPVSTPVGTFDAILPPFTYADTEAAMGAVPALGEHTDAVLRTLGRDDAQIADLRTDRTVG
jgi:crotonobetainyl-CoA:carnitine CoA-transferase CaiB-like acyl-CoA transferase